MFSSSGLQGTVMELATEDLNGLRSWKKKFGRQVPVSPSESQMVSLNYHRIDLHWRLAKLCRSLRAVYRDY